MRDLFFFRGLFLETTGKKENKKLMEKYKSQKNMIKTLIIEDEKPAARRLERMLSTFPELEIQKVIHSVEDGVQWLSENEHPKLIFSDIVLGDGLSFDILRKFPLKVLSFIQQHLINTL